MASEIRTSFNGGELSPLLAGRTDVAKFASGCERMENFLPTTQGPAISRPGFRFVKEVKDSSVRTLLVRFEFSTEDAYMLEFGNSYIRFYADRGVLLNAGVHYEISSPYNANALFYADGTPAIRYVQTGDVVYLVHPDVPPHKLSRLGPTNWTLAAVDFMPPPFRSQNTTTTTIYASASTGSVTLTASAAVFTSVMVGEYVYLGEKNVRDTKQWEAGKVIALNDIRRYNGKNYQALNGATTGGTPPTHSSGAAYDGDAGVQWQFLDPGYGWAKITAFTSSTVVTATVVSRLPSGAVLVANATTRWALQAWGNSAGFFPSAVTFFRERLVLSAGSTVWFSVTGDFENFAFEIDGAITADAGFDRVIASDRTNSIRWLSPGNVLLLGTLGDEWAITEQTTTDAFGPTNAQTRRQSTYGSNLAAPVRVGNETLFVQKAGRKLRAMQFRFEEDGFESPDLTPYAEHVTKPTVIDIAFQQEPWSIVWCVRSDGVLVGCTYNREQDVVAWHRHPIKNGFVECVETIPSPDGGRDDVWIIVRMTIDGSTKRYVCYLGDEDDGTVAQADWFYVDVGLTYSGPPATTITGLDHLEGQTVQLLTDGAVHPDRTVSGGAVTLQAPASKVQAGLALRSVLETTQLNIGRRETAQGKIKRVHRMVVRLLRSLKGRSGPSESTLDEMKFRSTSVPMGSPPPSFTGDVEVAWPGDYDGKQTLVVVKDTAAPVNVVALIPKMQTVGE